MDSDELNRMALLNVKKVSEWLPVMPSTVYVWVAEGKIPALKIQGVIRFRRDDIEAWLDGCQLAPPTPPRPVERRQHGTDHIDALIARAKAEAYTPSHGRSDQDRATRKGEHRGTV
jgi:excisionase family DNA binding protein